MIGVLLPFIWILAWYVEKEEFPSGIKYLIWMLECAALMLLVYTFSRWAILAGICSAVAFGWIAERPGVGGGRLGEPSLPLARVKGLVKAMKATWLRVSVLVIALVVTGAWGRFLIVAQGDRSVLNRFTMWNGGLKMIADRPFSGWGDGSAGVNFDNWYQHFSTQILHASMTNSWLNVAVEWGLPALGVILFGLLFFAFLCLYLARNEASEHKGLLAGAGAIVVFFGLVNVGYTAIYYVLPLVVLGVAGLIIAGFWVSNGIYLTRRREGAKKKTGLLRGFVPSCETMIVPLRKPLVFAFAASAVCVISLYLGGIYALRNEQIRVERVATGNVLLHKAGDSAKAISLTIAPDYRILGPCYGRLIRNALVQDAGYPGVVQVLEPEADFDVCAGNNVLVLGARVKDWGGRASKDGQRIVFVCPTAPPNGQQGIRHLFLPQKDWWHVAQAWKEWAEKNDCPITYLPGNGFLDEGNLKKIWDFIKTI